MNPPDRTAVYRVSRNGHAMGEHDIDRIVELLDSGEFLWTDLCWTQGMAGWGPLTQLRGEVAAAKAFPPVAGMPMPVASGRRRMTAPPPQAVSLAATPAGSAGWWWIVGGVTLGALVGLLCSHFFPTIVQVDRPVDRIVEKTVEKPVEVVRTVEKPVEVVRTVEKLVPAQLTEEQKAAEVFYRRFYDISSHKKGSRLLNLSDRVKVISNISGGGTYAFSEGLVKAKVEAAFRSHGFKVLSSESKEYPFNVVYINGVFLDSGTNPGVSVSGSYGIEIAQPIFYVNSFDASAPSSVVIKDGDIVLYEKSGAMIYGSYRFGEIVEAYSKVAFEAASELRKANDN